MEKSKAKNPANKSQNESSNLSDSSALGKLFMDSLKDIYWAEKHLTKALPKLQRAATSTELKEAFEDHLCVTEDQVSQLEKVFDLMGKKAQAKKCEAIEGLIKEGNSIIEDTEKGTLTRDAGLIMAAQKVEHYEIATYGSLVQMAKTLKLNDVARILEAILKEEKEADQTLTEVAENKINIAASNEEEGGSKKRTGADEENE